MNARARRRAKARARKRLHEWRWARFAAACDELSNEIDEYLRWEQEVNDFWRGRTVLRPTHRVDPRPVPRRFRGKKLHRLAMRGLSIPCPVNAVTEIRLVGPPVASQGLRISTFTNMTILTNRAASTR